MASAAAGSLREHPRQRGEQAARREANPLRRFAPALPKGEVSPKVTERALPLPCGELPPQRLRGLEMAEHKKALSEAASFFVWSPSSLGLKGASSPFLVGPARRNRWHFSGSLLVPKENNPRPAAAHRNRRALAVLNTRHLLRKPVCGLKAPLGLSCPPGTAVLSGSLLVPKENNPRPAAAHRNRRALAALNTRHLLRKPVCGLKAPLGLSCPPGTAVLSGSLLVPKENNPRPAKLFHIIQKLLFISCFSASTVRGESTRGCCGRPSGRRTARRSPC